MKPYSLTDDLNKDTTRQIIADMILRGGTMGGTMAGSPNMLSPEIVGSYNAKPFECEKWQVVDRLLKDAPSRPLSLTPSASSFAELKLPKWLSLALDKLANIEKLPSNWDSYGSPPPSRATCNLVRKLLFNHRDLDLTEPVIAPIVDGGVYLKLKNNNRELLIEFDDQSLIYATSLRIEKIVRGEATIECKMHISSEFNQAMKWLIDSSQILAA